MLNKSIKELSSLIVQKKISSVELIKEAYKNIDKYESKINSFITLRDKDEVLKEAKIKDSVKSTSTLYGLPFVLKDAYVTKNIRTTSASKIIDNFIPPYSATVYKMLQASGAILLGKMNMDAWGHGGSTENTDYNPTHNPWDLSRVAGGSSGGPAAAISAQMTLFGIGEDTGGSIRNPAAWTNTTGLKVSYGRVSRYGAIAYASSFDSVGPMAKTAEDCAYILSQIAGIDPKDATSSPQKVLQYESFLEKSIKGKKIAYPKEFFAKGLDKEIKSSILGALKIFESLGAKVVEVSMPIVEYGLPTYYLIGPSETSSNLGRYDSVRYGGGRKLFTPETNRRIMIGTYALSAGYYDAYYRKAQQVRTILRQEYHKVLSSFDAIIMPVTPTPPTKIGELISDPLLNLLADIYTTSQNPVGVPSIALPSGFDSHNLPIGFQLVGNMFKEELLLNFGYQFQQATDWHKRSPNL